MNEVYEIFEKIALLEVKKDIMQDIQWRLENIEKYLIKDYDQEDLEEVRERALKKLKAEMFNDICTMISGYKLEGGKKIGKA